MQIPAWRENKLKIRQRIIGFTLAVITAATVNPLALSAGDGGTDVVLAITDDAAEAGKLDYGGTVTVSVAAGTNGGFWGGTLYFDVSDNLVPDTAAVFGTDVGVSECIDNASEYFGFYAVPVIYQSKSSYTGTDAFCTVTFNVTGLGSAHIRCVSFDFVKAGEDVLAVTVTDPEKLEYTVNTPDKPVIDGASLSYAVLNREYSATFTCDYEKDVTWAVSDGTLPGGMTLDADGILSGTPTEAGTFNFSVTATLLDSIASDPAVLTLEVLEKPKTVELTEESELSINKDKYLLGVPAETKAAALLANFKNVDNLRIVNSKGDDVTASTGYIGTGCTVQLMNGDETVDSVTVVVRGDADGNGRIGAFDYMAIRADLSGTKLTGAYFLAGDVDGNGRIGAFDYMAVRAMLGS